MNIVPKTFELTFKNFSSIVKVILDVLSMLPTAPLQDHSPLSLLYQQRNREKI